MMTIFRSWRCLSRRHFARISISDMLGLSSMNSGASLSSPIVRAILVQSDSSSRPWRSFCSGILASALSIRMVISVRLISRLKITDVSLWRIDAERGMSGPIVAVPPAGRAVVAERRGAGDAQPHRGLTDRRAGRQDDHLTWMQPVGQPVRVGEAGRDSD